MNRAYLLVGVLLAMLVACDDETYNPLPDGRDYFPHRIGRILEYKTDSIIFDDIEGGNTQDTFSGFIREQITSKYENLSGDTAFVIERSFRRYESESWVVTHVLNESSDQIYGFRQEGNLTQIKMRFPLRDSSIWNPTAFIDPSLEVEIGTELINMFSNWLGKVWLLNKSEMIGGYDFPEVLTCQQADDDNELERRFVLEKYANDVGLVLRIDTILDSRCKRLGDFLPCLEDDGNGNLVPHGGAAPDTGSTDREGLG